MPPQKLPSVAGSPTGRSDTSRTCHAETADPSPVVAASSRRADRRRLREGRAGFRAPARRRAQRLAGGGRRPHPTAARRRPPLVDGLPRPGPRPPRADRHDAEHPAARGRRPGVRSAGAPGGRRRRAVPAAPAGRGRRRLRPRQRTRAVRAAALRRGRLRLPAAPGGRDPPPGSWTSGAGSGAQSSPRTRASSAPSPPTTARW